MRVLHPFPLRQVLVHASDSDRQETPARGEWRSEVVAVMEQRIDEGSKNKGLLSNGALGFRPRARAPKDPPRPYLAQSLDFFSMLGYRHL